jgi:hypothetical protein
LNVRIGTDPRSREGGTHDRCHSHDGRFGRRRGRAGTHRYLRLGRITAACRWGGDPLNSGTKTGTFAGTQVADFRLWLFKGGRFNFEGLLTFTGTVAGCGAGTIVFRTEGTGFLLPDGTAVITRGHQHTLSGQGTLPVQASLDSLGVGTTLSYTGEYQC